MTNPPAARGRAAPLLAVIRSWWRCWAYRRWVITTSVTPVHFAAVV